MNVLSPVIGVLGPAVAVGQPSHSWLVTALLGAAILAAALLVLFAMIAGPDWLTALALGVLFSNAGIIAMDDGIPGAMLLPYLLLIIPAGFQIAVGARRLVWGWPTTAMVFFGALAVTSMVCSPNPGGSLGTVGEWALEGVVFLLAVTNAVRSEGVLRRCVQAIALAGAMVALLVLRQHLTGNYGEDYLGFAKVADPYDLTGGTSPLDDGTPDGTYRSSGMIGEPNFFAMAMAALLPWIGYLVMTSRPRWLKAGWLGVGLLVMESVVLSYSRGALVALGAVVLGLIVIGVIPRKFLLGLPAVVLAVYLTNPESLQRLLTVVGIAQGGGQDSSDVSARGRFAEVFAAVRAYLAHPWLGVGPGQFPSYFQRYAGTAGGSVHVGDGDRNAHNLFAGLAADVGTLGLLAFGFLMLTVVVGLWRVRADPRLAPLATAALSSLAVYLCASLFLHLAYARYLWLYVALSASLIAIHARRHGSGRDPLAVAREPSPAGRSRQVSR